MPQWSEEEVRILQEVREKLGDKLTSRPQYPEVVGDRKLSKII